MTEESEEESLSWLTTIVHSGWSQCPPALPSISFLGFKPFSQHSRLAQQERLMVIFHLYLIKFFLKQINYSCLSSEHFRKAEQEQNMKRYECTEQRWCIALRFPRNYIFVYNFFFEKTISPRQRSITVLTHHYKCIVLRQ